MQIFLKVSRKTGQYSLIFADDFNFRKAQVVGLEGRRLEVRRSVPH